MFERRTEETVRKHTCQSGASADWKSPPWEQAYQNAHQADGDRASNTSQASGQSDGAISSCLDLAPIRDQTRSSTEGLTDFTGHRVRRSLGERRSHRDQEPLIRPNEGEYQG